ncbi:MAG: DNA methyltransferase, partial [Anaerolineae bacterium]|nr:DNA methyltransferase [Anaerolineae bacterium]
ILESLQRADSPIRLLAQDWRALLFPDADDAQFADAYAQTLTFALLLGRLEGAHPLTPETAAARLQTQHGLLARALSLLTDPQARPEIDAALNLLLRLIGALPPQPSSPDNDPWLYFYEDFLAVYDPHLRRDAGAYYTPLPVVQAQVRLVDELLRTRLHKKLGFAHPDVLTLDPALGTGTYLLSIVEHALHAVRT